MTRNFNLSRHAQNPARKTHESSGPAAHSGWNRSRRYALALGALALAAAAGAAQSVFPATVVGTPSAQQTVTVTAQASGTVDHATILTLGQPGLDFALPAVPAPPAVAPPSCVGVVLTAGGATPSCAQTVVFTPAAPGLRVGAVELFDALGDLLGETLISGTGVGGLAVLVPGNTLPAVGDGNYLDAVQDNVPALNAELYAPTSVTEDGAGNLYIADSEHNRIRMVSASTGLISTIAGTGAPSYTGDNGLAAGATLNTPSGIAMDGAGNLFIADTGNNVIRRIDGVTHVISTIAGGGLGPGFSGDGGAATSASLNLPQGVAVDAAGNLYIADTGNHVVREVAVSTGKINTVAGDYYGPFGNGVGGYNGDGVAAATATLNHPYAVAFDASGNLYIADTENDRIRMVNAATQVIFTVAGSGTAGFSGDNGAAAAAELNAPTGIALDPAGNLYIGDTQNYRIRKVSALNQTINTLAVSGGEYLLGTDSIHNAILVKGPQGVYVDSNGNVIFADTLEMQVWEIESNMAALDFTVTPVRQGSYSTPLFQTVENDGNDSASPLAFTSLRAFANAQIDTSTGAGACVTTQPLAVDNECTIGVIFSPATNPALTANTVEAGTVSAAYTTTADMNGPNSPLSIVAVGIAKPLNSTTTTVSATPDPSLFGQAVTFTVQVTTGAGTGALTGTVSIFDTFNGTTTALAAGLALNGGAATYATAALPVGVHTITASYSGDAAHSPSNSTDNAVSPWIQTVEEQTAIALTSSADPSLVGQSVTFTAIVTAPDGGGLMPDGTVSFLDGTNTLFTGQLSGGTISYTTSALTNGVHPITAVYSGDVTKEILGETSAVLSQDVQTTATVTLATSGSPSYYGSPVMFKATVASSATVAAGRTVTFYDANVKIGTVALNGAIPDIAQFTISTLAVGTHSITASYAGDSYNTAGVSLAVNQVVVQTVTADIVTATPNPGIGGLPETITATVRVADGAGTPTGLVTFTSGLTVLGTANLTVAGTATIAPVLAPGSYSIVASYAGDADDGASQSAPLTLTVGQAQTATVVAAVPNPSTWLQTVTFAATVTGNGATPIGTVDFFANGALIGAGTLNTNGVATLTYSNLAIGTYAITAEYLGETNDAGSTSLPLSLTVGKIPTTTSLGSSTTSGANPQLNLVATVLANVGPIPTGTVTFTNALTALGTATLDATGVAALDLNLPAGTYVIEAVYSGDATHAGSTSLPITVTTDPIAFNLSVTPTSVKLQSSQYAQLGMIMTSVGGFTDTIGLGCASLPPGVTCHFSSPTVKLPANGNAVAQLTIDTNSPLTGGSMAASRPSGGLRVALAGLLLPFSVVFGFIFRRARRRMATALMTMLFLVAALALNGCGGISTTSAAPGTFTIQVVCTGTQTGVTESQNVTLTITK